MDDFSFYNAAWLDTHADVLWRTRDNYYCCILRRMRYEQRVAQMLEGKDEMNVEVLDGWSAGATAMHAVEDLWCETDTSSVEDLMYWQAVAEDAWIFAECHWPDLGDWLAPPELIRH